AVLGLHACTDAERSGPYSDRRWTVNRYAEAAERFMRRPASALPWGKRIEFTGVMELVTVEDVIARFEAFGTDRWLGISGRRATAAAREDRRGTQGRSPAR